VNPTPATLLIGLVLAAPSIWAALIEQTLPAGVAAERLVVILVVVSVVGSALRGLLHAYTSTDPAADAADILSDGRSL
jgi:hypothetical protein